MIRRGSDVPSSGLQQLHEPLTMRARLLYSTPCWKPAQLTIDRCGPHRRASPGDVCRNANRRTIRLLEIAWSARFEPWVRAHDSRRQILRLDRERSTAALPASAGLLILDWPPHPFDPDERASAAICSTSMSSRNSASAGWRMNSFERCRSPKRAGAASAWSRCTARDAGRPIYERLRFSPDKRDDATPSSEEE